MSRRAPLPHVVTAALALALLVAAPLAPRHAARAQGQAQAQAPPPPGPASAALTPYATVPHKPLGEMSGIVKSRRYPDVYWVHNDSGDVPRLFAIRAGGQVVVPTWLRGRFAVDGGEESAEKPAFPGLAVEMAANSDWEDIAVDGDTLYIADVGNNGNARRDLGVYVLAEPNPEATERARVQQWLPVVYEDQKGFPDAQRWQFDCEAVFARGGKLYFVTKHRAPGQINTPATGANLYRMDTRHADRPNVLKRIDGAADLGGWVTAADLSPDGKTLAVLSHYPVQSVWLFEARDGDKFLSGRARRLVFTGAQQCEAICWEDADTLLMTSEQRGLFRLKVSDFRDVPTPGK